MAIERSEVAGYIMKIDGSYVMTSKGNPLEYAIVRVSSVEANGSVGLRLNKGEEGCIWFTDIESLQRGEDDFHTYEKIAKRSVTAKTK